MNLSAKPERNDSNVTGLTPYFCFPFQKNFTLQERTADHCCLTVTVPEAITGNRIEPEVPESYNSGTNLRPALFGATMSGLVSCSLLYLLPTLICQRIFHPFLATNFLMAALSAPIVAAFMVGHSIKRSNL